MAFIVEVGTGTVGATSLVSVIDADLYFSDVGNTVWDGLTTLVKQQNLIKATRFFERRYKLYGKRKTSTQGTVFPRTGLMDELGGSLDDTVPLRIKNGISELALIVNSETLFFTPILPMGIGQIIEKKEKVGPIEETIKYQGKLEASAANVERQLPEAEYWFRGFIITHAASGDISLGKNYR